MVVNFTCLTFALNVDLVCVKRECMIMGVVRIFDDSDPYFGLYSIAIADFSRNNQTSDCIVDPHLDALFYFIPTRYFYQSCFLDSMLMHTDDFWMVMMGFDG